MIWGTAKIHICFKNLYQLIINKILQLQSRVPRIKLKKKDWWPRLIARSTKMMMIQIIPKRYWLLKKIIQIWWKTILILHSIKKIVNLNQKSKISKSLQTKILKNNNKYKHNIMLYLLINSKKKQMKKNMIKMKAWMMNLKLFKQSQNSHLKKIK